MKPVIPNILFALLLVSTAEGVLARDVRIENSELALVFNLDNGVAISGIRDASTGHVFLDGARSAYATIVRAYSSGDRETLKPLLSPIVNDAFEAGIPESFNVLVKEMRALGLNVDLINSEGPPPVSPGTGEQPVLDLHQQQQPQLPPAAE